MTNKWQPIATAPKDGSVIDLWDQEEDGGSRLADCLWSETENKWVNELEGWIVENPTHWMPLPQGPNKEVE